MPARPAHKPSSAAADSMAAQQRVHPELERYAPVLDRLLESTQCPIVLVDNASGDDSVAAATRTARRSGGRVTVIPLDRNEGAVARNIGVARCDTPYVAFCDDDSWWAPGATALAEEIFERYPTVALLAA